MSKWNLTPKEAVELQKTLREQVRLVPLKKKIKFIAGCDVSMNRFATVGYAGFVVLSYPDLTVVDHSVVKDLIPFPYIPGLLSFREIPMLLKAWRKLKIKPDVVMVDGVGIAHPRRLGIATHLGLELGVPTIGCAKSLLVPLVDKKTGEVLGEAVQTKPKVKPMYISPGNGIDLPSAVALVRACVRKHRLPEPTRLAHLAVNEYRRKDMGV